MLYAGLFCTTLATLMLEIDLTRILSATMSYHFAFVAISVAMFGMTLGALLVYLLPSHFAAPTVHKRMALHALLFAVTAVLSLIAYVQIPFKQNWSLSDLYAGALIYIVLSVPFVFSGVVVTLALTKVARPIGRLYAADLAGAASGCIVLIYALDSLDALTVVLVIAAIASIASMLFAMVGESRGLSRLALLAIVALVALAVANTYPSQQGKAWLRILTAKGSANTPTLYDRWNSFSRVTVRGTPDPLTRPTGWGWSETLPDDYKVRQLWMEIDSNAGTPLQEFTGDKESLKFLKYDVTNIAHHLRSGADVVAIGVGGGRDVLAGLAFDQRSILGVELNANVLRATTEAFGEFTGRLDKLPNVRLTVDEARSYLTRTKEQFDLIQISLIDTWAATAAGAFALSENSLYTVEAWTTFLGRLKPGGVLTVSRWFYPERPAEFYRVTALAAAALRASGVDEPRGHIAIVYAPVSSKQDFKLWSVATLLVSPDPFSPADIDTLHRVCKDLRFQIVLGPGESTDPAFEAVFKPSEAAQLADRLCLDLSPPTDDRPFFFNMLRVEDLFNPAQWAKFEPNIWNMRAIQTLGVLLVIVTVLMVLAVFVPLAITRPEGVLKGNLLASLAYFACIGTGFMFIEIAQLQGLVIFLGHPTYALSTVLFTILLASGAGSFLAGYLPVAQRSWLPLCLLGGLVLAGGLFVVASPRVVHAFADASTPIRIAVAVLLLAPTGLLMGMPFPLGMMKAAHVNPNFTPWLWAVNGAASVWCSVLATSVSMWFGISRALAVGVCCYGIAAVAYARMSGKKRIPLEVQVRDAP